MVPQGGSGSNAPLPMKDIIGYYFGLDGKSSSKAKTSKDSSDENNDNSDENDGDLKEDSINFSTQLKK